MTDLILIGLALVTSTIMAILAAVVNLRLHEAVYALSLWGIIPVGAVLCGMVAASGYFFGARLLARRPGVLAMWAAPLTGVLTYIGIYYAEYAMLDVRGVPLSSVMSFGRFVDTVIRSTTMSIAGLTTTGRLGAVGYPVAIRDAAGFLFSGFLVYGHLIRPLHCRRCGRYLPPVESTSAYGSAADLAPQFKQALGLAASGRGGAAMALVAQLSQQEANHKLTLDVSRCQCGREYFHLTLAEFTHGRGNRDPWVPVRGCNVADQVESAPVQEVQPASHG